MKIGHIGHKDPISVYMIGLKIIQNIFTDFDEVIIMSPSMTLFLFYGFLMFEGSAIRIISESVRKRYRN